MNKERLSKEEFDQLNILLGKHGFGGYYDLLQCLKMIAGKIGKDRLEPNWEQEINDLPSIVGLLFALVGKRKNKTLINH